VTIYKLCFLLCYVCTLASATPPPNSAPQLTSNGARLLLPPPTTRVQRGPFPRPLNSPPTRSVILPPPPARATRLQRGPRLCHHSRPCESPPTNPAPCRNLLQTRFASNEACNSATTFSPGDLPPTRSNLAINKTSCAW
jgi:hypothetical protein